MAAGLFTNATASGLLATSTASRLNTSSRSMQSAGPLWAYRQTSDVSAQYWKSTVLATNPTGLMLGWNSTLC